MAYTPRIHPATASALALVAGLSFSFAETVKQSAIEPQSLPAPDQVLPATPPVIQKIDGDQLKIGEITLHGPSREIRFPAKVQMDQGLLEFIIVHENGKIHESLLCTAISPTHLNLAFTLLKYQPSPELYLLPNETGGSSSKLPTVAEEIKAAARILIEMEWTHAGETHRVPINTCIQHTTKKKPMPPGPWVYGGSRFRDGQYAPELSGDISAIFITTSSIINYPGDDNRDDTAWTANSTKIPPAGTPVTVIISPYVKNKISPQPSKTNPAK
jgi:hypothetical protein